MKSYDNWANKTYWWRKYETDKKDYGPKIKSAFVFKVRLQKHETITRKLSVKRMQSVSATVFLPHVTTVVIHDWKPSVCSGQCSPLTKCSRWHWNSPPVLLCLYFSVLPGLWRPQHTQILLLVLIHSKMKLPLSAWYMASPSEGDSKKKSLLCEDVCSVCDLYS